MPVAWGLHQSLDFSSPAPSNDKRERRSRKFSRKFVKKNRFSSPFGRRGAFGKSRAKRGQNSRLIWRLATPKTFKKRLGKNSIFCVSEISFSLFFLDFGRARNFGCQNQFPRELLFQIHLFGGPCDQKLQNDSCCENLASASLVRVRSQTA